MKLHKKFKFKPREEVLYNWVAKNSFFKAIILKQLNFDYNNLENNKYSIRVLNYQDGNWTLTVQECDLLPIENPNKLMKDIKTSKKNNSEINDFLNRLNE